MAGPINLGMNLSDFGLTAPSDTNSLSPQSNDAISIDELLGSSLLQADQKAELARARADELRGQSAPSVLDRLKSPQGLASLLAALGVGAAAAGGGGAAAGLVAGLSSAKGSVSALQAAEMEEEAANRAAIEDLEAQADKAEQRAEKIRNRVSTMFNTNPDAFIDPETGEPTVSTRVLGWMTTGQAMDVFPQTRRMLDQRDERWTRVQGVLEKSLAEAQNPAAARQIVDTMWRHSNWTPPAGLTEAIVSSVGTGEFDNQLFSTLMRYGGSTGLDAAIFAGEAGLPLGHPEVLRRVKWMDPVGDTTTPSQQLNTRFISLMDKVYMWEADPRNAAQVQQIKQSSTDSAEARRVIVERALENAADVDFYFDKANVPTGMELRLLQQMYGQVSDKYGIVETVRGTGGLDEALGMDEESWRQHKAGVAAGGVEDLRMSNEMTQAGREVKLLNEGAISLRNEVPGMSSQWYSRAAQAAWNYALDRAEGDFESAQAIYQAALAAQIQAIKGQQ